MINGLLVTAYPKGGWQVIDVHTKCLIIMTRTQKEAYTTGKKLAKAMQTDLYVHDVCGKIRLKHSYRTRLSA